MVENPERRQNSSQEPAARRCRRGEGGGGAFQPGRPQCGCRLLPLQRQPGRRSSWTVASFYLFPLFAASGTGLQLPSRPPWPSSVLFFPVPCLDHSLSPLTYRNTKRLDFCAFSLTLFFFFFPPILHSLSRRGLLAPMFAPALEGVAGLHPTPSASSLCPGTCT